MEGGLRGGSDPPRSRFYRVVSATVGNVRDARGVKPARETEPYPSRSPSSIKSMIGAFSFPGEPIDRTPAKAGNRGIPAHARL